MGADALTLSISRTELAASSLRLTLTYPNNTVRLVNSNKSD